MQLSPWPAYSPDMSPVEHVWHLFGRSLTSDPRLVASKQELWLRVQAIRNSLLQANIQNPFDYMFRRIAVLITTGSGYTKY